MGRKREMAAAVFGSALARVASKATAIAGGAGVLRILAYHRILDDSIESFQFDEGVISASTESFRQQMIFAKRDFDVISFADLLDIENGSHRLPKRPLIVTFDDGYRDNYVNAFPVLKQLGLPATIFLATGHIGRPALFWWDLIAVCLKRTTLPAIELDQVSSQPLRLSTRPDRRNAIETILRWIKSVPEEAKRAFLEQLPGALQVSLPPDIADRMTMSWDEVRLMAAHDIEFGSHTVNHPVLSNIDHDSIEEEVGGSKRAIERELGKQVVAFAYPVGGKRHFNQAVQEAVARAGYRYAVSYEDGLAGKNWRDRYALPRIHVEADYSLSVFRANLMFPRIMFRSPA